MSVNAEYKGYTITTDKGLLQPETIHKWLSENAYWCKHIPFHLVKNAFDNSYTIGAIKDGRQIAYARLITDYSIFGYLADVYVEEQHRGKGISKKMMELLMNEDWVKNLRVLMLATVDAKGLYEKFGFTDPKYPERLMQITRPAIYGDTENRCK